MRRSVCYTIVIKISNDQYLAVLSVENGNRLEREPGILDIVTYRSIVENDKIIALDSELKNCINENILQETIFKSSNFIEKFGIRKLLKFQSNNDKISKIATKERNVIVLLFLISVFVRKIKKAKPFPMNAKIIIRMYTKEKYFSRIRICSIFINYLFLKRKKKKY